jgi:chloramphenicol O-acetyltransferase type B
MKLAPLVVVGSLLHWIERARARAIREYQAAQIARHTNPISLAGPGYITGLQNLTVEPNVHMGKNFFIRAEGGVRIGENTHISHGLTVYSHSHDFRGDLLPYSDAYVHRPVDIGRNVWIGIGVTIVPGTTIGDGAIIGAGATLHGSIPPGAIIGSAGWVSIGSRDMKHYAKLEAEGAYSGKGGKPLKENQTKGNDEAHD